MNITKTTKLLCFTALAGLLSTGCSQKLAFQEIAKSCEPPTSSARYGNNIGPVILQPAEGAPANGTMMVSGTCADGYPLTIEGSGLVSPVTASCAGGRFSAQVTLKGEDGTKEIDVHQPTYEGTAVLDRRCFAKDTVPPRVVIQGTSGAQSVNTTTVVVEGTCENGIAVEISGPQLQNSVTTQCNGGRFRAPITFSGSDGLKDVIARQVDPAGNNGDDTAQYMTDTTVPVVTIASPAANSLSRGRLTIAGTCEVGPRVLVQGAANPAAFDCIGGNYSGDITLSGADGVKNVEVSQADISGNTGRANRDFIKDTSSPMVRITSPVANSVTRNSLTIGGTCEAGFTVRLSGSGVQTATNTNCVSGAFSANVTLSTPDGAKAVEASQTDLAGNTGLDTRSFIRDADAPAITITSPAANSIWPTAVSLQGTCESGLVVQISGTGALNSFNTNCTGGNYSALVQFSAGDGTKNLTASQTDLAGNVGSANRNFVRDSNAPDIRITAPADGAFVTATATIVGTCETGTPVVLSGSGLTANINVTCSSGAFSQLVTFTNGDGSKPVVAAQTDGAGNTSSDSKSYIKDTTAPSLVITGPAANTVAQIGITLTGTCETGLAINIDGAGVASSSTANCVSGTFSAPILFSSGDGAKTVTVSTTDAAGNIGTDSRSFMRDSTAPVISINSPANNTSAQAGVTIAGSCETGLSVTLSGTGVASSSTTTCVGGAYSTAILFSAGEGTKNVMASQTDASGNTASASRNFVRDNSVPLITISSPAANSYVLSNATIQGTCETGPQVVLSGAGLSSNVTTNCLSGNYSVAVSFSSGDGIKNVVATQTDGAGNVGQVDRDFIRDASAPLLAITAPAANAVGQSGLTISGTCETGLTVTLSGTGVASSSTATCTGSAFSTAIVFSSGDGAKNVVASQTDSAGNVSTDSRVFQRDSTGPAITISSPAANTAAQTGVTVAGSCEIGLTVVLNGTGLQSPVNANCLAGNYSAAVLFSAGEGVKNIVASQTDGAGNTASANRNFTRDNTGPAINIASPAASELVGVTATVTGSCETGGSVVVLSGAGLQSSVNATCTAGAFSGLVTFTLGDGNKMILASQSDSAGNSNSDTVTVIRDGTAPAIAITAPAANSVAQTGLTISGTCETGLTVTLSGTGVASSSTTSCTSGAFSTAILFSTGEGTKNIVASQTDASGNTASANRNFTRDNTGPAISIASPAASELVGLTATVTGTCETGGSVVVLSGSGLQSSVNATCTAGAFSGLVTFTLGDGNKIILASQSDSAGNSSSDTVTAIRDGTAPTLAITAPAANSVAQTGLTISGTCETGLTVTLSGTGVASSSTTSCVGGAFSTAILFSTGDGAKNVVASQTDASGNVASDNRSFLRDTTAPAIAITSPAANTTTQTGLTISGTCETGLTVTLSGTGVASSSTTSCTSGAFSAAILFSTGDGAKNVVASQTDASGNAASANRSFLRDTTAPTIAITSPAANTTAQTGLTISGTCETGLTVTLSGAGVASSSTTSCTSGAFSTAILFSAGEGVKNIVASQTDASGNTASANRNFTRDNTGPAIAFTSPAANSYVDATGTLEGTCESGLTVLISGTGLLANTNGSCISGNFSIPVTFSLLDGNKSVMASQSDSAGNTGSDAMVLVRDGTAPFIAITSPAANTTTQTGLTISGTCETGLTVTLSGTGVASSSTTSCTSGAFSAAILFSTGDGAKNVVASQTDASGNTASANRSFLRDTTAPTIAITSPAANTTAQTGLTISGTCETGLTVTLSGTGVASSSTTSCTSGAFSAAILFSTGDGAKNVVASQTDASGNTASANRNFTRDNTGPAINITSPAASELVGLTATVTGTCETGGSVVVLSGSGLQTSVNATCTAGAFSGLVTITSGDGNKMIVAAQNDSAGNTGTDTVTVIRDGTAPTIAITSPATNSVHGSTLTLTGTCETGLIVNLSGAGLSGPNSTSCAGGTFSVLITFTSGDGTKAIMASQTDASSNTGSASRSFIRDTTAPAIFITQPAQNSVAQNGVTIQGTCETGLLVQLAGTGLSSATSTPCSAGVYSLAITFSSGDGSKLITASQTDSVGNTGSDSRTFIRDATSPLVLITSPAAGTSSATGVTIGGTCETGLTVNLSGALSANVNTTCVSGAFSAAVLFSISNGTKTVIASQTDGVGNTGSDSRTFMRSNNAGYDSFTSRGPGGMVDILFVDDNSASMDAEQIALGSRFSSFTSALTGLDWQAGITTTDCTAGSPYNICGSLLPLAGMGTQTILNALTPNYLNVFNNTIQRPETMECLLRGDCPSGREEGLKATIFAMNKRNAENTGFFRNGADLAVVYLTDEDEQSNAPSTATQPTAVINNFRSIWGTTKRFSAYGIIVRPGDLACLNTQRSQLGSNAFYATLPDALVQQTGGLSMSICAPDYSVTLAQIGEDVTRLSKSIDLTNTPLAGSVSVQFTPSWSTTWEVTGNRITFDNPAPLGTLVEIFYEY